jgi:hypothetical protein
MEQLMEDGLINTRCVSCGMIQLVDGWHLERRERWMSYRNTICPFCSIQEVSVLEDKNKLAEGNYYYKVRQAIEEQALRHWRN